VTARDVFVIALLAIGVGAALLGCAGVFAMRRPLDRLHYTGPASTVAPVALALAVLLREGASIAGVKTILVAALLLAQGPVLTHATARALVARRHDRMIAARRAGRERRP
jgi:multisubunit Na+/H+ antiporter MnhG subunit